MQEEEEEEAVDAEEQETEGTAGMCAEAVGRARAQHADCCSRRAIARARMAHTESLDRETLETCLQTRRPRSFDESVSIEEHSSCACRLGGREASKSKPELPDLDEWMRELKRVVRQRKHSASWSSAYEHEDACPDVASMAKNDYPAVASPADLFSLHSSKSLSKHHVNLQVIGSAPGSRDVSTDDLWRLSTGECEGTSAHAFTQEDAEIDSKVHAQLMELNALFASLGA